MSKAYMIQEIINELNRLPAVSEMPRRVELCRQALEMISKKDKPELWAKLQDDLACSLIQTPIGSRAENIEQAIHHFELALEVRIHQKYPKEWAMTQNNLGTAYRDRIRGKQAENIEKAIDHYKMAMTVRTREADPERWALTQFNLGGAYYQRIRGKREENLELAIYYFRQALEAGTDQTDPKHWATIQYSLGKVYRYRIHGGRSENIEQAIYHYQQALEVHSRSISSIDWANLQTDLGSAYLVRIRGDRLGNIEQSIHHFQQALEVKTHDAFPKDWAHIQNDLGIAYLARINGERAQNIEEAICCFEKALEVRTRQAIPEDWAGTLNNLAGAMRIHGSPEEIEQSIEYIHQALEVYTRQAYPQYWARAQNNLALAYTNRKDGKKADNIEHALQSYQQALEVYTSHAFPNQCLKTARELGNLAFEEQRWELSMQAYDQAFDAQNVLMRATFLRRRKQAVLREAENIAPRAAYVYVQMGNLERAVEVLEHGRAQLLRESIESRRLDMERLPALGFGHLYQDYKQAIEQYNALQSIEDTENAYPEDWIFQMEQALEKVQTATVTIREKAGQSHPQYRYLLQPLPFTEIQKQAMEKPLVYLSTTPACGLAIIVTKQDVQAIKLPKMNQKILQEQIWHLSEEETDRINSHFQHGTITPEDIQSVSGGYFSTYALWRMTPYLPKISRELLDSLFEVWQEVLDQTTHWLWGTVMGDLITTLKRYGESATFILTGQLALLPLHAAWTEDTSKPTHRRYALDEMTITYTPSAYLLWQASLSADRPAETLLAVENPDGSLDYSKDEVLAALNVFKQATHLPGKKATVEAVKKEMQKAQVLHFSTHGNASWQEAEQSRLKLADGYLTLPDILELNLNQVRLAVLSANETGMPGLELIDEMIGLAAEIMQAGVPGVIGSLWSVNNGSTALLMAGFYRFWRKEGKLPQEALRQAQIWLRDNLFESPYYWAAFTYTGV
jgi:tetratricopeptide (TPR) repeat protein